MNAVEIQIAFPLRILFGCNCTEIELRVKLLSQSLAVFKNRKSWSDVYALANFFESSAAIKVIVENDWKFFLQFLLRIYIIFVFINRPNKIVR